MDLNVEVSWRMDVLGIKKPVHQLHGMGTLKHGSGQGRTGVLGMKQLVHLLHIMDTLKY